MARLETAPATLTGGGRFQFAGVVININGVTDPAAVANRVAAILKKRRPAHHHPDPADGSGLTPRWPGSASPPATTGTTRPRPGTGSTTTTTSRHGRSTGAAPTKCSRTDTGKATSRARRPHRRLRPHQHRRRLLRRLAPCRHQAKIELQNQDTDAWSTLFRGFIASIQWTPYRSREHANVTLELVDGLALLAACEMAPNGDFGDSVDDGNIVFADEDARTLRRRPNPDQQGPRPGRLARRAPRHLHRQRRPADDTVYAPRSTVLSVIQDAADAEFPDAANVYISGPAAR